MIVHLMSEPFQTLMKDNQIKVSNVRIKGDKLMIDVSQVGNDRSISLHFNHFKTSNDSFDFSGASLTNLTVYDYRQVFKSRFLNSYIAEFKNGNETVTVEGGRP